MRIERFKNDPTIEQPLSEEELNLIKEQYCAVNELCKKYSCLNFNQLVNLAHQIRQVAKNGGIKIEDRLSLIAIGRLLIRLHFNIYPYSTQILALLGVLVKDNSRQAQIKTGEGKSTIVAHYGFVRAMECRAVDNITSTRYLAIRDWEKYFNFYERCGITSSHICLNNKTPDHFNAQILYGPAFDFEFAWMQELLWGKKFYQQRLSNPYVSRNFDIACVDESDNLLVDAAQNLAILAVANDVSYDWIYAPILSFVREYKDFNKQNSPEEILELRNYLKFNIPEHNQKICDQILDNQFEIWLKSAKYALFQLKQEVNYVVKKDKNKTQSIQIIDIQTGRLSDNSRWSEGIHEFLEVKHDIVVQKESLSPISLSHAVFYDFYQIITAFTGTAERFQTKQIYQIDSFDVPPHLPSRRIDLPPVIGENNDHFYELVIKEIDQCIQERRPILIICETIEKTQVLEKKIQDKEVSYKILNEIQVENEKVILLQAGHPSQLTIATATAGRGTDIIICSESLEKGGLHVVLTCLFQSKRDVDQAIGRAGRQGQPGSSIIILNKEDSEIQELLKEQKQLTDQEIIELLDKKRNLKEKSQALVNIDLAPFARFLAEKTHAFYKIFRTWADFINQDILLTSFAQSLAPIKLRPNKQLNFTLLDSADLLIAEECKQLLSQRSEILSWKVFLKKVSGRIQKKVIYEWVENFFKPAEAQLKESGLKFSFMKVKFEEILNSKKDQDPQNDDLTQKKCLETLNEMIELVKNEITEKFNNYQVQWDKYLAQDGSGLFVYLKEITTVDFLPFIKNKNSENFS